MFSFINHSNFVPSILRTRREKCSNVSFNSLELYFQVQASRTSGAISAPPAVEPDEDTQHIKVR